MKKKVLSMILAIAMVMSMFAGIAITASAAEGTYVFAQTVAVGDTVILAAADGSAVFTEVSSSNIGSAAVATPNGDTIVSAEAAALTVEAGVAEGSIALKTADGKYLAWTSGNKLYAVEAIDESSSWIYAFAEEKATLSCVKPDGEKVRNLQYNAKDPRFCAYTSTQTAIGLFKLADGDVCLHENATSEVTTPAGCTENGLITYTCSCGASWTEVIKALGHSNDEGTIITAATCTTDGVILYTCTVCGSTKESTIPATGHTYVDGACACGATQAPASYFKAIDLDNITEGKYLIGAVRGETYPNVYIATAKISSGDITTTENFVTVAEDFIYSANIDDNAQIFTFTGNNVEGFAISYEAEGEPLYLGVSDYANNRKLAWSAEYANVLWTVGAIEKGGYYLSTAIPESEVRYTVSQNSTGTAPIRGYKSGALYTGIYLFVEAQYCAHENTTEIAAVEATCTTAGNTAGILCTDCGATVEGNEYVAALGHDYQVAVSEGKIALTCTVCGDSQDIALDTIADAKAYEDNTREYNVKGVVTYISGTTVYIQDENDGLCVYFAKDVDTSTLALGDEIFVSATMTDYKGLLELNAPTAYTLVSTGNELPVATVTLADLAADTTNEYLGERVYIEGLKIGTINPSGSTTLTDAEGNTIALFKANGLNENINEGDTIKLTAIVSKYNSYQLIVNPGTIAEDVVETEDGTEPTIITVPIAEAKVGNAGEYFQVEGVVTAMSADKRTIYVQDATGGIALYLNARPAEAVCAIGDMVKAKGAYKLYNGLIELDSIDPANVEFFEILSSGNAVEAQKVDIATLLADTANEYLAEKVAIEEATIAEIAENGTITLTQGEATITIYKAPALGEEFVVGAKINVTGVVGAYNGYQILVNEAADIELVVEKEPTLVPSIRIQHTLNLASDISINFCVSAASLTAYDSFYMECKIPVYEGNDLVGYDTVEVQPVLNGSFYYFTLVGITAVEMNNEIEATLFMETEDEKFCSNVDVYGVSVYAYAQLAKATAPDALKALCAELLRYGALAQSYKEYRTDALVDAKLTEADIALLKDLETIEFYNNKADLTDCASIGAKIIGRSLSLDSKVTLNYIVDVTGASVAAEDVTVHVSFIDMDGLNQTIVLDNAVPYGGVANRFSFAFDALTAAELRCVLTAAVYVGDTQISNSSVYSIDTYGVGKKDSLLTLCQSLMSYSDTALAYFKG